MIQVIIGVAFTLISCEELSILESEVNKGASIKSIVYHMFTTTV